MKDDSCDKFPKLVDSIDIMRKALENIANGNYNDLSANPSDWSSTQAAIALGWKYKDGKLIYKTDISSE